VPYGTTGSTHVSTSTGSSYALHVSLPTIDHMLRVHNIKKWLVRKRPKLKADPAKASPMGAGSQGLNCKGLSEVDLWRQVQGGEGACRVSAIGFPDTSGEMV
jgi:hypothetical protein